MDTSTGDIQFERDTVAIALLDMSDEFREKSEDSCNSDESKIIIVLSSMPIHDVMVITVMLKKASLNV